MNWKIDQVELYNISDNMSALVKTGKYGSINRKYTTEMGWYVIKFHSVSYS